MAQTYPHDLLPDVSSWRFSPGPNALQSDGDYAHVARRRSSPQEIRTGEATWVYLEGENAVFQAWYKTDLNEGIRHFYIRLPAEHTSGFLWHVAKFVQKRVVTKGYGYHEVNATLEVRTIVGAPPVDCVTVSEYFVNGLTGYATINGVPDTFTVANNVLTGASHTVAADQYAQIRRTILSSAIAMRRFSCEFRCLSINADDTVRVGVYGVAGTAYFVPARDSFVDALRRPRLYWQASNYALGSEQLPLDEWYTFSAVLVPGTGISYAIRNIATSANWASGTISAPSATAINVTSVEFLNDSPSTTGSAQYRKVRFSSCE